MLPKMMVAARIETKSTSCMRLDTVRFEDQPSLSICKVMRKTNLRHSPCA